MYNAKSNEDLYLYLLNHFNGNMADLRGFDTEEITNLCKLGFLKRGKADNDQDRFSLTSLGQEQIRFMCIQSRMGNAMDGIISFLR